MKTRSNTFSHGISNKKQYTVYSIKQSVGIQNRDSKIAGQFCIFYQKSNRVRPNQLIIPLITYDEIIVLAINEAVKNMSSEVSSWIEEVYPFHQLSYVLWIHSIK